MDGKPWQAWLRVGVAVALVGLVAAFAVGLLLEAVILLATVVVCALSLIPLLADRRLRNRPGRRAWAHPAGGWPRRPWA